MQCLANLRQPQRQAASLLLRWPALCRGFAEQSSSDTITVETSPFRGHKIDPPERKVETSKQELLDFHRKMWMMRRVELAADQLYKQKLARGFLHLADGQEAIPTGMEAALTFDDSMIQSYRDHLTFIGRGGTPQEVFAELLGRVDGSAMGKGGSMHMYSAKHHFYGGSGIVGEQVPLGAGLGFAHGYRKDGSVAVAIYGDGAANQGQVFEAYNVSALWSLPVIYVCENNHFGMGTADERAAKSDKYYTRGDYIPGLWVDGMDVLAVKHATGFAKKYVLENGPIVLEMDTYRYHGHSISDPGTTYRTRDDIKAMRTTRDPIEHVKQLLTEHGFASKEELKAIEKEVKAEVDAALEEAKKSEEPSTKNLWEHTYKDGLGAMFRPLTMDKPKIPV